LIINEYMIDVDAEEILEYVDIGENGNFSIGF
jgi:hypothetical protein